MTKHSPRPQIARTLAVFACLAMLTSSAYAQSKATGKSHERVLIAFKSVVAQPSKSTVRVLCDGKQVAQGTILSADGLILTKASELRDEPSCMLKDGREFSAKIVGIQDPYDLALLKIEAEGLDPIVWKKSKDADVGDWVVSTSIKNVPAAVGVVSVRTRTVTARDLPASVNTKSGYLGVGLAEGKDGVLVTSIQPGTAAAKIGLKRGDEIVEVEGKKVTSDVEALIKRIQKYKPGEKVTIVVLRDDDKKKFIPTLGKRPAELNRGEFQNRLGSRLSDRRNGFPMILQHDTVIKPEECGGPLVDLDGKAIGINIARAGRTESYAVPSEEVLKILPELKSGKLAPKD